MSDYHPVSSQPPAANAEDASHLQILAILFYVFAGLNALSVVMLGLYAIVMGAVLGSGHAPTSQADAAFIPLFIGMIVLVGALSLLFGVLHFMVGQRLRQRRGYKFCQVVSVITCLSIPLGTVLGAFTLIVLNRPSVRALFGERD